MEARRQALIDKSEGTIEDGPYGGNGGGSFSDGGEIHLNGDITKIELKYVFQKYSIAII